MADEQPQEQHSPICREAAEKRALLEGYRIGTLHGYDEAIAVMQDLPPTATVVDALTVLGEHRETWSSVLAASMGLVAAIGTGEVARFDQG